MRFKKLLARNIRMARVLGLVLIATVLALKFSRATEVETSRLPLRLHNPGDVVRFKNKFVATEIFESRLAIFDDLSAGTIQYLDGSKIGKQFSSPHFLAVTLHDTLLISNGWGDSIVEIEDLEGRGWKEFKGRDKDFHSPHGICVDKDGWIYVADSENSRLVRFRDMTGKDWQIFPDHEKIISYVRQLRCEPDGIWAANSYVSRPKMNPGSGGNILRITDFASGAVETILRIPDSDVSGVIRFENKIIFGRWKDARLLMADLESGEQVEMDTAKFDLGTPYGLSETGGQNQFLVSFFGSLLDQGKKNRGGLVLLTLK